MAKKKDLSKNLTPIKKKPINTATTNKIAKKVYQTKKHEEQRYTINMPISVYEALKDYAHNRGASMKYIVVEAIREKIGLE